MKLQKERSRQKWTEYAQTKSKARGGCKTDRKRLFELVRLSEQAQDDCGEMLRTLRACLAQRSFRKKQTFCKSEYIPQE